MLLPSKIKSKLDQAVTEPIRNTAVLAIFACVVAIIAIVIAVVK